MPPVSSADEHAREILRWSENVRKLLMVNDARVYALDLEKFRKKLRSRSGDEDAGAGERTAAERVRMLLDRFEPGDAPRIPEKPSNLSPAVEKLINAEGVAQLFTPAARYLSAPRGSTLKAQVDPAEAARFKVAKLRRSIEQLLARLLPVLSLDENEVFETALELCDRSCRLEKFEMAFDVLLKAFQRAYDIERERRGEQVPTPTQRDRDTLRKVVTLAAQSLADRMAPWRSVLEAGDLLPYVQLAALLRKHLDAERYEAALALQLTWSEAIDELPGALRHRILDDVHVIEQSAAAEGAAYAALAVDTCAAVRQRLAPEDLEPADILAARALLPRVGVVVRQRCDALRAQERKIAEEQATEAARRSAEAAAALERARREIAEREPRQLDDTDALLARCPPGHDDTIGRYQQRADVVECMGRHWLSLEAYVALAAVLAPRAAASADAPAGPQEPRRWKVVDDNPRVRFTDSAALDKAAQIIRATCAGADPVTVARELGCSTPSWHGDMLEIRLTRGATQLRLIAMVVGPGALAFVEIKSFHAAGDSQAGHLKDYLAMAPAAVDAAGASRRPPS